MNLQKTKAIRKTVLMSLLLLFANIFICAQVSAQSSTVSGVVTDNLGEPVIGASVSIKGTGVGTATDMDGKYSLTVPTNGNTLVISYIGLKTKELPITGNIMDISMEEDAAMLDEVVVIGYGTVKKKDLTGAVSSISSKAIEAVPVSNTIEAMAGKLAGVQITATEGSPDAEMVIRVRGGGSISQDNTPLFIVDGFPVSSISDISPTDIETIDVLKDASSSAIYGSRGANGVVIITTKSGKEGKVSVNYNAFYAWKKTAKTLDMIDVKDYAKWQYELAMLRSGDPNKINPDSYTSYFGNYQDIDLYNDVKANDWQEQTFGRVGHTFNHNLSINGGSDKMKYAFSYAHIDDKAIMEMSDFKRDNLSLKLNSKPVKNVWLDFSARYSNTQISGSGANESRNEVSTSADSRLKNAMIFSPLNFINMSDGYDENSELVNPLVSMRDNDQKQLRRNFNYNGSFTWEIFSGFIAKTEFGLDYNTSNDSRFYGTSTYNSRQNGSNLPIATFTDRDKKKYRNTNTINYDFKNVLKNDNHSLTVLIGQEYIKATGTKNFNDIRLYPDFFTANEAFNLTNQGTPQELNRTFDEDDILLSFFGRLNYSFQSKYLASATFRADGSSKFSEGNRWGYFPSAAVAWRISSEEFMENTKGWLNDLKLRISYGTAGNNNIPSGQIRREFSAGTTQGWINNETTIWSAGSVMPNPDLVWETTYTRNIGLDYALFGGKLNGTFETYWNSTDDLLLNFPVTGSGYNTQYRNMGETENKGFEASINWHILNTKDYGLSIGANIGFNKNKIKSLGVMNDFYDATRWSSTEIGDDYVVAVGGQVGQMYGYQSDGRYEASDFEGYNESTKKWILKNGVVDCYDVVGELRPGVMKLKNTDGSEDNKVTQSDKSIIGNANPVHTGGLSINGRAHGFDLTANFTWSYGNDVYNANKIEYTTSRYQYRSMLDNMADGKRWTNLREDGTISNNPDELAAMNANTTMWSPFMGRYIFSDWAVEDGSFLRLSTLSIGYTLPKVLLSKYKVENLRLYVTGYNVFCWTNYSGFDPEVSTRVKTPYTPGVDYSAYPKSRQFVVGLNLTF